MRLVKHRSIKSYVSVGPDGGSFSPLIGRYNIASGRGWRQCFESDDGGYFSVVGTQRQMTDALERRVADLWASLDELMPRMFEVIEAQPPPFEGFDIDQLEIDFIYVTDESFLIKFCSEQLNDHDLVSEVEVVGSDVRFSMWSS